MMILPKVQKPLIFYLRDGSGIKMKNRKERDNSMKTNLTYLLDGSKLNHIAPLQLQSPRLLFTERSQSGSRG